MAYPSGVKTRMVSFGGAATVEAGTPLDIRISTVSSRSLIWVAEGYRLESLAAWYQSALEGDEILFEVPTTDQSGWMDAETRQAIIVEPGQASHLYTTTLDIFQTNGAKIRTYTIGPYAVPDEPGVIDGDLINPDMDPVSGTLTTFIPGPEGPQGNDGSNVLPTDTAIAQAISTPGSETQTQLNATFVPSTFTAKGGQLALPQADVRVNDVNAFELSPLSATTWETPDGTGVVVHPSVRYFPDGWNGHRWWGAITPYYNTDNQVENPCILVSDDGITWTEPDGLTNPLIEAPFHHDTAGYNSDTHLTPGPDGRLYCFYRASEWGSDSIWFFVSEDGINWSGRHRTLFNVPAEDRIVSPAVWWDPVRLEWVMLGVSIFGTPAIRPLYRFTSPNLAEGSWSKELVDVEWPVGTSAWHLDAALIGGSQVVSLMQVQAVGGASGDLYLATSEDGGRSFTLADNPLRQGNTYRSCLLPILSENGLSFHVWVGDLVGSWNVRHGTASLRQDANAALPEDVLAAYDMAAATRGIAPFVAGDTFNRDDAATLGQADSGQQWSVSIGAWEIANGQAKVTEAGNSRATIDFGVPDYEMSFDVVPGASAFIVARFVDGSNYLRFGRTSAGGLRLERITSGAATVLGTGGGEGPYRLKMRLVSSNVECFVNGTLIISVVEAQGMASTVAGIQSSNTDARFKNLLVKQI